MGNKVNEIKRIVQDTKSLPTLPGIVLKISKLAEDDKSSVNEIARLISSDHILSAKVLKLVNSPFYGFSGRVSTISNALILLGVNVIRSLALSSSIFEIMEKSVVGLWEHSFGAAVAANTIAKILQLPDAEEISTAALLHDIGKAIIKIKLEEDYNQLISIIKEKDISMIDAEHEFLGTGHPEIGEWIARTWFLPEKLIEPIACHHNVKKSVIHKTKTAAVHLADILVKASDFGFSGDDIVPRIQTEAWDKLDLNEKILEEIVQETEDRLIEAKNFSLEIQTSGEKQS
ncbi:MAG: HDOD domain-containing protein [Nitrospirae bacterium]|jgi:putative nucleotidyltransferase with HDIG domain|nr:HDOD domain-containing protein [Nitrospirota bacterium]